MLLIRLFACITLFGLTGFLARGRKERDRSDSEMLAIDLFTGAGILSFLLFGMSNLGLFRARYLLPALAAVPTALWVWQFRQRPPWRDLLRILILPAVFALAALLLFRFTPPYEAIIAGDDASIYTAAAEQLASSGGISYNDALAAGMAPEQKRAFFSNRFREDWTGPAIRFPGGVRLTDPETGSVHFAFYHLAPVWMAFSMKAFGTDRYLLWVSLLGAMTLASLFFLGRRMGGIGVALTLPLIAFVFYPQQYFSRLPLSEPLAQFLFLSGLLCLLRAYEKPEIPDEGHLLRAGLLWGASFLSRIDSIYVVTQFFLLTFALLPGLYRSRRKFLALWKVLAVSVVAALFCQLQAGEYVTLLTNSDNLRKGPLTDLALDLMTTAIAFVQHHGAASVAVFLAIAAGILLLPARSTQDEKPAAGARILSLLLFCIALVPVVGIPSSFTAVVLRVRWFFPYVSPAPVAALSAGLLWMCIAHRKKPAVQVCAAILGITLMTFMVRVLIYPEQPWAMRRFYPMAIPLFLLLALSGWWDALSTRKTAARLLYAPLAAGLILLLYSKSAGLFAQPLYRGLLAQTDALAAQLPPGATVLIPDAMAGLHLELPLQYRRGIPTLLLPLDYSTGRRLNAAVLDFMDRKLKEGPLFAISSGGTDLLYPLWKRYDLSAAGTAPLDFALVPRTQIRAYPENEWMHLRVSMFRIAPQGPHARKDLLSWNDRTITFLHFHEREAGFVWTRDSSTITDFTFPTEGDTTLLLRMALIPPGFDPARVRVEINYRTPAELTAADGQQLTFRLRAGRESGIRAITFHTPTFREGSGGRELGISFESLALSRDTSASGAASPGPSSKRSR